MSKRDAQDLLEDNQTKRSKIDDEFEKFMEEVEEISEVVSEEDIQDQPSNGDDEKLKIYEELEKNRDKRRVLDELKMQLGKSKKSERVIVQYESDSEGEDSDEDNDDLEGLWKKKSVV